MLKEIHAKSIIIKQKHPEYWFNVEYNMNLYKGCSHGCIYCDSRSLCYKIENFDEIMIKKNAISILEKQLVTKRKKGIIGTGSMSDPYNAYEKEYQLTRKALEVIEKFGFEVFLVTKSNLVTRDIDLFKQIQKKKSVCIGITITTYDDEVCKTIEPNVANSTKRFEALKKLSNENIYCGILMMPLLPGITGTKENINSIVELGKKSGARFIYPMFGLTLRSGNREYFYKNLDKYYPRYRKRYEQVYGSKYVCNIPNYVQIKSEFVKKCKENNIVYKMEDIITGMEAKKTVKQLEFVY